MMYVQDPIHATDGRVRIGGWGEIRYFHPHVSDGRTCAPGQDTMMDRVEESDDDEWDGDEESVCL